MVLFDHMHWPLNPMMKMEVNWVTKHWGGNYWYFYQRNNPWSVAQSAHISILHKQGMGKGGVWLCAYLAYAGGGLSLSKPCLSNTWTLPNWYLYNQSVTGYGAQTKSYHACQFISFWHFLSLSPRLKFTWQVVILSSPLSWTDTSILMGEGFWVLEVLFSKWLNKQVQLTLTIIIFLFFRK